MQFNLAILSLLASSLPATIAQRTEDNAFTIKTFGNQVGCGWGISGHTDSFPDGECFHLPREFMDVKKVTETCRVFIYNKEGCSGFEQQVYPGEDCVSISNYRSIKAFCH